MNILQLPVLFKELFRKSFHFCSFPNFEHKLRSTFFKTQYLSSKDPPGLMVYVSTPLSLVPTQVLAAIPSPPILICSCWVSRMVGWAWERSRERTPEARYCSKDHREQAVREDDVSSLSEWLSWVGQLKETALGSPSAESALSFPKLGCWDTSITASYSFGGKRDLSFLHLDNLTSCNQTNRLSSPLSQ